MGSGGPASQIGVIFGAGGGDWRSQAERDDCESWVSEWLMTDWSPRARVFARAETQIWPLRRRRRARASFSPGFRFRRARLPLSAWSNHIFDYKLDNEFRDPRRVHRSVAGRAAMPPAATAALMQFLLRHVISGSRQRRIVRRGRRRAKVAATQLSD